MADQSPYSNVKLSSFKQKWCFYVLLYNKRGILDFFHARPRLLLGVLLLVVCSYLVGKLLNFLVSGSKIFDLLVSLNLDSMRPVLDRDLHIDSIVGPQNILQIFARIENVNTYSSIKTGRLEKPEIFPLVL